MMKTHRAAAENVRKKGSAKTQGLDLPQVLNIMWTILIETVYCCPLFLHLEQGQQQDPNWHLYCYLPSASASLSPSVCVCNQLFISRYM